MQIANIMCGMEKEEVKCQVLVIKVTTCTVECTNCIRERAEYCRRSFKLITAQSTLVTAQ